MGAHRRRDPQARGWAAVVLAPLVLVAYGVAGPVAAAVAVVSGAQFLVLVPAADRVGRGARRFLLDAMPTAAAHSGRAVGHTTRAAVRALPALLTRGLPALVGCAALLAALDWGVGAAWSRLDGPDEVASRLELADATLPAAVDERRNSEAYAGQPWVERYFEELAALDWTYVPFIGPADLPVRGRHITVADGVRRSYEPVRPPGAEVLDIWFFGGSTLWGEGQRDLHTIPSEVARLAEEEGVTLAVSNFGERGYTAFQEALSFERAVGRRDPPDIAVFYHGVNEHYSLLEHPDNLGAQPSQFQIDVMGRAFHRAPPLPAQRPPGEPSVLQAYRDASLLHEVVSVVGAAVAPPAAAQGRYNAPPEAVARAEDEAAQIYRRSVALIDHLARAHGVEPVVFWQPWGEPRGEPVSYARLGGRVGSFGGGIDISDALDEAPGPVSIDGVHTNELGARLAAEAIWRHLAPVVREAGA